MLCLSPHQDQNHFLRHNTKQMFRVMQFCRKSFGGKKIARREASCFNWNLKKKIFSQMFKWKKKQKNYDWIKIKNMSILWLGYQIHAAKFNWAIPKITILLDYTHNRFVCRFTFITMKSLGFHRFFPPLVLLCISASDQLHKNKIIVHSNRDLNLDLHKIWIKYLDPHSESCDVAVWPINA